MLGTVIQKLPMSERKPEKIPLPTKPPELPIKAPVPGDRPFSLFVESIIQSGTRIVQTEIENRLLTLLNKLQELRHSQILVYYSIESIDHEDAKQFYELITLYKDLGNLDLYLLSPGGLSDPAFKIARLCQQYCKGCFTVIVPYYAKSAATILALGADKIFMGPTSELGPIDPQLIQTVKGRKQAIPLLALKQAIDSIKEDIKANPELALLYKTLIDKIDPMAYGLFEREVLSAQQYAEQLLKTRMLKDDPEKDEKAKNIAKNLVDWYKTHRYVIDMEEAKNKETLGLALEDFDKDQWDIIWQLHLLYDAFLRAHSTQRDKAIKIFHSTKFKLIRQIPLEPYLTSESEIKKEPQTE